MTLDLERSAWIVSGVGLLGSVVGWIIVPSQFPHAWLAATTCWLGWPLGSIALVLIHALTGGSWGWAIRRQLMMGIATLPLFVVALLPILAVRRSLYPWMNPQVAAHLVNRFYLDMPFFYSRVAVYLIAWSGLGFLVLRAMRQEDPQPALQRIAPFGLIVLALTVTFSAIDFTLSLEPRFRSSIYGLLVGSEAILFALSIGIMGIALAPRHRGGDFDPDLGRLLLGLLVSWAYLDFMQLLIVWNSNLPDEAPWYVQRLVGSWGAIAVLVAGLHFVLPFFALIWPRVQRSRAAMGWLAALLVVIEIPRAWWMVVPAGGRSLSLLDVTAMMTVLGAAAAAALWAQTHRWFPAGGAHL